MTTENEWVHMGMAKSLLRSENARVTSHESRPKLMGEYVGENKRKRGGEILETTTIDTTRDKKNDQHC